MTDLNFVTLPLLWLQGWSAEITAKKLPDLRRNLPLASQIIKIDKFEMNFDQFK